VIKTLKNTLKNDKEKFIAPKGVQDVIPINAVFDDGIFLVGKNKYSKSYKFSDINYTVASKEDKESMFLGYSELLNSLDSGATTKITINNKRLNKKNFEKDALISYKGDKLDVFRNEYNKMLQNMATSSNATIEERYITVSVHKKSLNEARNYFARIGASLASNFANLGAKFEELSLAERLQILYDFYRTGEEENFHFDLSETMKKGHNFKDLCPDSFEFKTDYFKMGERFGRVLFLKEYASYIKDSMVSELMELGKNMMLSIDVVPVPTDEAIKEVESRLLGVETNICNWQRHGTTAQRSQGIPG